MKNYLLTVCARPSGVTRSSRTTDRPACSFFRPGEILALEWKHVAEDHVEVLQRLYRGKLDWPKSERSKRKVALSSGTWEFMDQWRRMQASADADAEVGRWQAGVQNEHGKSIQQLRAINGSVRLGMVESEFR